MENCITVIGSCLNEQSLCLDKTVYEIVRNSILKHLLAYGVMTVGQLSSLVEDHLKNKFPSSLSRCYESVRRDLEARGEIRRIPQTQPQLITMAG